MVCLANVLSPFCTSATHPSHLPTHRFAPALPSAFCWDELPFLIFDLHLLLPLAVTSSFLVPVSFCRDELPFLIDLHLFLSRPLKPAPVQGIREAAAAVDQLGPDASLYGTFPQASPACFVCCKLELCT